MADTVSHEAIYTWIYALPKGELGHQGILLALRAHVGVAPAAAGPARGPGSSV